VVPAITINIATGVLGMTPRAAGQNLERLVAVGILREIPGTGRTRRLFIAPEVLNAIEGRPSGSLIVLKYHCQTLLIPKAS
jgi:hypothetical protein